MPASVWRLRTTTLDLEAGILMGIVNATPDSFTDGGEFLDPDAAANHARTLIAEGADIVDVGGESTRPGAEPVPSEIERRRITGVLERLGDVTTPISVDTYKPEVARTALDLGAELINDVTGGSNPEMVEVIAEAGCGVVLMHMKGQPATMHVEPSYDDVVSEVEETLLERCSRLRDAGVDREQIAIDPGIGFGKNAAHNLTLLNATQRLSSHGYPMVLGTSRKKFLRTLARVEDAVGLDEATAITTALAYADGARVFRVHSPRASGRALALSDAIVRHRWDGWSQD